jgi:hypothetical protein
MLAPEGLALSALGLAASLELVLGARLVRELEDLLERELAYLLAPVFGLFRSM